MKGKDECTYFGNWKTPPKECECKDCVDIDECANIAFGYY